MTFTLLRRFRPSAGLRLGVAALLIGAWGATAVAQDEGMAGFFRADQARTQLYQQEQTRAGRQPAVVQRPTHLIRRAAPVRGFTRAAPEDGQAPPQGPAQADAPNAAAPAPEADRTAAAGKPTFNVLVIGDSLGQMLGQGLADTFADRPDIAILRKARESTGLVRDDFFDWVKGARDLLASTPAIGMAVMMVGSNDRQPLRDAAGAYDPRQPRWTELYGDRVAVIAAMFRDRHIPLVWVGLPVMRNERFSADMSAFNEIYQDRATKAGATFVDTWEAFQDDRGQFAVYGPDVNGQFEKLRAGDGVHFTRAGARKLAHFVEADIRHAIEDAHPSPDALASAPLTDSSVMPAAPAAALDPIAPAKQGLAVPAPAAPAAVVIPVKPLAGPVASLTGPPIAADGVLATRAPRPSPASSAAGLLDRVIVQGQPIEARPGRADDFAWPRR